MELRPGLYETLITNDLAASIAGLPDELVDRRSLTMAEAADRIALYLGEEVNRALAGVPDDERVGVSLALAQRLFDELAQLAPADPASRITQPGEVLHAVLSRRP